MRTWFEIALVALLLQSCYREEVVFEVPPNDGFELTPVLSIQGKPCCLHAADRTLRCPMILDGPLAALVEHPDHVSLWFEGMPLEHGEVNDFGTIKLRERYELVVQTGDQRDTLTLSFTNLPVVHVVTPNPIHNEPKTLARMHVIHPDPDTPTATHWVGIEHRGRTSLRYNKKSYGLALKDGPNMDVDRSASLSGMLPANKWMLNAAWVDPSRMRNGLSFDLWMSVHGQLGMETQHVEVFVNQARQGLYEFSHRLNAETMGLEGEDAVVYKAWAWEDGATQFATGPVGEPCSEEWDGWCQEHPDPAESLNWGPLQALRELATNGSDEAFAAGIADLVNLDNLADGYVVLNVVMGLDNAGKNLFWVEDATLGTLHMVPWDMDGTWGRWWDGAPIDAQTVVTNGLFRRLIETNAGQFRSRLKDRWGELRNGPCAIDSLKGMVSERTAALLQSDAVDLENSTWGAALDLAAEEVYIHQWLDLRLARLDEHFAGL